MVRIKHRYLLVEILYPSGVHNANERNKLELKAKEHEKKRDSLLLPIVLQAHAPTPDAFTVQHLLRLLRHQLADLFGEYGSGVAAAGLSVKYWSNATSTFIVRCARSCERMVWAAITYVTGLKVAPNEEGRGGRDTGSGRERNSLLSRPSVREKEMDVDVVMKVLRVSGTMRKCQQEAIRQARALCGRAKGLQLAIDQGLLNDYAIGNDEHGGEESGGVATASKGNDEDSGDSDLLMDDYDEDEDKDEDED